VLWSLDSTNLYELVSEVYCDNGLTDRVKNSFGVRTIHFDAQNGFQLNGETINLKGACVHHDNGPLGAKAYDRAEERRVEKLIENGYNAVRCSHNPPSQAFLDACDNLGLLVIDEAFDCWIWGKNPQDYHLYFEEWWKKDIDAMVKRDVNHPSIIMWSIGNEIPGMVDDSIVNIAHQLSEYVKSIDSTRPVTAGVQDLSTKKDPFFSALDVQGYNYPFRVDDDLYLDDHKRLPSRIMYCSESYPIDAFKHWMAVEDYPWVIGDFVWTGIDNIGEASIGWLGYPQGDYYPWNLAHCGDLDICLWKRPQSYYRDVLWKNGKQLYIFVKPPIPSFEEYNPKLAPWSRWNWQDVVADWNWDGYEGKPMMVEVYSAFDSVELFLNEKLIGVKSTNCDNEFIARWEVPYAQGSLIAIGFKDGKRIEHAKLNTSASLSKINLKPDRTEVRANGQDLCYVEVELSDSKNIINPKAENLIKFEVSGPATIVGVGNSNPKSLESYTQPQRSAWRGRCLVILKSTRDGGVISLKVTSQGLETSTISIESKSF
jgi:beta-galactosidase